jgi:hypothetical protein
MPFGIHLFGNKATVQEESPGKIRRMPPPFEWDLGHSPGVLRRGSLDGLRKTDRISQVARIAQAEVDVRGLPTMWTTRSRNPLTHLVLTD